MGFFKDLHTLTKQGKEMQAASTPGADMRAANEKMRQLNASLAAQTAALTAPPGDALDGQVQIVSTAMTAGSMNGDPLLRLAVLILSPGRPPVPVDRSVTVPAVQVHRIQPGAVLPAHLSAADPTAFAFDWAQGTRAS